MARQIGFVDTASVAVDSFRLRTDPDDTLSFSRAIAANLPIFLGPKTYFISQITVDLSVPSVTMTGIPGLSVVRRNAGGSGGFIQIAAPNVALKGVTFDMNKASVTANQWGVLITSTIAQDVIVEDCTFMNNSGTIGAGLALIGTNPVLKGSFSVTDCEIFGCSFSALYLGSVGVGFVSGNYVHDNNGNGIAVTSFGSASSTNFASNIIVEANRIARCQNGIQVGGISPPYVYGTPAAVDVTVRNNTLTDISASAIIGQGDYIGILGNTINQSSPSVSVNSAIDNNGRFGLIAHNDINYAGSSYGIDAGGSQSIDILDNHVTVTTGAAINPGGGLNCRVSRNLISVNADTSFPEAITVFDVETDGSGIPFPYFCTGLVIDSNTILMNGVNSRGISLFDNPGGRATAQSTRVTNNNVETINGASTSFALTYVGGGSGIYIEGNSCDGPFGFANPNINTDIIPPDIYDEVLTFSGASPTVRSLVTPLINTYGAGGSILWVYPQNGGANYTAATVLSASGGGGSGWAGTPLISQGVIVGVRTTAFGSGYSGAITITATDTGGGSGATFIPTNMPTLPTFRKMRLISSSVRQVLQLTGGFTTLQGNRPIIFDTTNVVNLIGNVRAWTPNPVAPFVSIAVGSLPTPSSAYAGAIVNVTGSTTGKWQARCDGSSWIWPDGTTVTT